METYDLSKLDEYDDQPYEAPLTERLDRMLADAREHPAIGRPLCFIVPIGYFQQLPKLPEWQGLMIFPWSRREVRLQCSNGDVSFSVYDQPEREANRE